MKNLFKLFTILFVVAALTSCGSKRPETNENFQISISGTSILKNAEVALYSDGKEVATTTTDENGAFELSEVESATGLNISVCKGAFHSVAADSDVSFTGCLNHYIPQTQESVSVVVDFLSTFITKYNEIIEEKTALEEWSEYLSMTTSPAPELQSSLTDATKRYLWQQGISKIAENVSKANGVTPESMYSTENLFNMLVADLTDDAVINGSTNAKFGTLNIEASILKSVLADAIPEVSETFSAADLSEWTDKIRYSDAKFLGGTGTGIDSEKPEITITAPTAGETVFSVVAVKAEVSDNVQIKSFVCALVGEDMPKLENTSEDVSVFNAEFNSALVPDGTHRVKCTASDGTNISEKEVSFSVSNSNKVALYAYITNPLTDWESVTVYDENNTKIKTVSFEAGELPEIALAPGTYRIVFSGGFYKPVFLNEENLKFDSTLETRVIVKAGENTAAFATPITTLREHLYRARIKSANIDDTTADEKSLELISQHIDYDFPIYLEPASKNQLTENSKYYFVLAALERLAILVGERHEPPLEKGSITIEQVLKALEDDLSQDTVAMLDGYGKINQFKVDSYLFRYWYAIALKLFIESEENESGLLFSTFQTVISNIATDESELFPDFEKPLRVTDKPPVISEKQFKRSFESEFQTYSTSNIIYSNNEMLAIKFKVVPDESGDLILDTVSVSGDIEELSEVRKEENSDIYSAEMKLSGEDGEKTLLITAIDNAENTGTATLQTVKDTVAPVIAKLGDELPDYVKAPLKVAYTVTETNPLDTLFAIGKGTAEPDGSSWQSLAPALLQGEIAVSTESISNDFGAYTVYLKAVDKAGNAAIKSKALVIDSEAPSIEYAISPAINGNGFINITTPIITIIAEDNTTPTESLVYEMFDLTQWIQNIDATNNVFNLTFEDGQEHNPRFRVKDLAGNTAETQLTFTVDATDPILTTNKTALESTPWRTANAALVLSVTCTDDFKDKLSYNIDEIGEVVISDETEISLTNNENLLEDGTHTINVVCMDKAGNTASETINIVIDNTPPKNLAATLKSGTICTLNKTYSVSAEDESSVVKFKYRYKIPNQDISSTYTANASSNKAEFVIPNSNDTFYKDATSYIYYEKVNEFTTYISAEDKAGNVTEEISVKSQFDKQGVNSLSMRAFNDGVVFWNPASIEITEAEIDAADNNNTLPQLLKDKFNESVNNDLKAVKISINGTTNTYSFVMFDNNNPPEHYCTYYVEGNSWRPALYCETNHGAQAEIKATFKDSCGNWGTTSDCKADKYPCLQLNYNNLYPTLYVNVTQKTVNTYQLRIETDGTITACSIKGADGTTKTCSTNATQTINTSDWKSQSWTVTATAKLASSGNTKTQAASFIVDNSAFVAPTFSAKKEFYNQTSPVITYDLGKIPTGIKSATFEVCGRKANYRYATGSGWTGGETTGLKVNSGYKYTVFTATGSTSKTGTFTVPTPECNGSSPIGCLLTGLQGGIYEKICYTIEPNFGDPITREVTLGIPIRYIKTSSEDFSIESYGNYEIVFAESIVSKKFESSYVTVSNTAIYNQMCVKNAGDTLHNGYIYNHQWKEYICDKYVTDEYGGKHCEKSHYDYHDYETKVNFSKKVTINSDDYNYVKFTPYTLQYIFQKTECDGTSQCANASLCATPNTPKPNLVCIPNPSKHYGENTPCDCSKLLGVSTVPACCLKDWFKDITYIPSTAKITFKEQDGTGWTRSLTYNLKNYITTKAQTDCP